MNKSRLWTDDSTGKYSSTALRTWLLFFLFLSYASAVGAASVLSLLGVIDAQEKDLKYSLELIWILGVVALGGGGLYLGKRVNERFSRHDDTSSAPARQEIERPPGRGK